MTTEQKQKISDGRKKYFLRKRQSEAMKASWVRRRAENGALVASFTGNLKPPTKRASLREIAELLGIDVDAVIRHEIKRVLEI